MIQKKVCMLGAFAVGKTSLVQQFAKGIFSEKYLTTVGVKIDKKPVTVNGTEINLILWDLAGEDEFQKVQMSYLRGSSGYLIVVDGTRRETLDTSLKLIEKAETAIGKVPFILLFNKADITDAWEIESQAISALTEKDWPVYKTSAKTGHNVEDAFQSLAKKMLSE